MQPLLCNRQPLELSRIAHSALTEGLEFAAIPIGSTYVDLVTGQVAAAIGISSQRKTYVGGVSARANEILIAPETFSNTGGWKFPTQTRLDRITVSGGGTLLCIGGHSITSSYSAHLMFGSFGSGSVETAMIGIQDAADDTTNYGKVGLTTYVAYGPSSVSSANALGDVNTCRRRAHFFGAGFDPSGDYFYYQNSMETKARSQGSANYNSDRRTFIANDGSTGWGFGQNFVALALGWSLRLPLSVYQMLYQNPWQIIERPRRRMYSIPAASPCALVGQACL